MATKRRVQKKSIKEDRLVTYSLSFTQWVQEHFNQVVTALVALVALVAVILFISHSRRTASYDSERYLGAAMVLFRQEDIAAAKTSFQDVVKRYGGSKSGAIARYFEAECALKLGSFAEAYNAYDAYLEVSKKYPIFETAATIGKALALEGQGRFADAGVLLEGLVQTLDKEDPRNAESLFRAGNLFVKAGNTQKAVQCFTTLAENKTGLFKEEAEVALATLNAKKARVTSRVKPQSE